MSTTPTIIPVLVYDDVAAGHDHLVEVYGFESRGVHRDGDGRAVHAEVALGDAVVWLHPAAPDHDLASPSSSERSHTGLAVTVPDVDAHHERVRAAGDHIDSLPVDQPYGRREYGVRDPEGHRWWFATPLPVAPGSAPPTA